MKITICCPSPLLNMLTEAIAISPQDVRDIILKLDVTKTRGPDLIS